MTRRSRYGGPWLAAVILLAGYTVAGPAAAVADQAADQPDFSAVLRAEGPALARVTSDTEALALFTKSLGPALGLRAGGAGQTQNRKDQKRSGTAGKPTGPGDNLSPPPSTDQADMALQLTGELAAWRLAAGLKDAADKGTPALAALLEEAAPQREWLAAGGSKRVSLLRALAMADLLHAFESKQTGTAPDRTAPAAQSYEDYAAQLDRTIPLFDSGVQESWLGIAEREGQQGIGRRLGDGEVAGRYWKSRLQPVFLAQVAALALRAEAEAQWKSGLAWQRLQAWPDRLREEKGLAKLCGSWQWTLHNHQNHQDHKMIMRFEPPFIGLPGHAAPGQSLLKPAKIVVLGDAVYLRWESAGGVQEDSLLFTGEGKRLEGSFVNSAGAWGSITGKRLDGCAKQ